MTTTLFVACLLLIVLGAACGHFAALAVYYARRAALYLGLAERVRLDLLEMTDVAKRKHWQLIVCEELLSQANARLIAMGQSVDLSILPNIDHTSVN